MLFVLPFLVRLREHLKNADVPWFRIRMRIRIRRRIREIDRTYVFHSSN